MSRCIGFGPYDCRRSSTINHCTNEADTPAGLWCRRCEVLRRESLSADFAKVTAAFGGDTPLDEEESRG